VDSSLVRGSVWIVAAVVAVLAIGWAGTGGCAGAANAQLRADIDGLTSRVQTLEGRVRKLEGGAKATRGKAAKGKSSKLASAGKAKTKAANPENVARTPGSMVGPAKAKAGKAAPPSPDGETEAPIPPG
jgi:outer membrane murein-binding lipoprotein Lpp